MSNWSVTGPEGGVYSFSAREAARLFASEHGGRAAGYRLSEYGARNQPVCLAHKHVAMLQPTVARRVDICFVNPKRLYNKRS